MAAGMQLDDGSRGGSGVTKLPRRLRRFMRVQTLQLTALQVLPTGYTHTHVCIIVQMNVQISTHMLMFMHTHARTHARTHTHTHTHTYTHINTHTYIHTYTHTLLPQGLSPRELQQLVASWSAPHQPKAAHATQPTVSSQENPQQASNFRSDQQHNSLPSQLSGAPILSPELHSSQQQPQEAAACYVQVPRKRKLPQVHAVQSCVCMCVYV